MAVYVNKLPINIGSYLKPRCVLSQNYYNMLLVFDERLP